MKNLFPLFCFCICFLGCKNGLDKETEEIYQAYNIQYTTLSSSFLREVAQHTVVFANRNNDHTKYIEHVMRYVQKNDSLLTTTQIISKNSIDSIEKSYNKLINEYSLYYRYGNAEKYAEKFPSFTGSENRLEQQVKIKQSNIYLLNFFIQGDYWLNKGERPYAARPELVSYDVEGDSTFYSFVYGQQTISTFYQDRIKNDTLFSDKGSILKKPAIKRENGYVFLEAKFLPKGTYTWTGDIVFNYRNSDLWNFKETVTFEIK